jgi:hypothetical protein
MSNEIIQSAAYDNYDDFQHINVIIFKFSFHYFLELFNDKTDLSER